MTDISSEDFGKKIQSENGASAAAKVITDCVEAKRV